MFYQKMVLPKFRKSEKLYQVIKFGEKKAPKREPQFSRSANLARYLARKYSMLFCIFLARFAIISHGSCKVRSPFCRSKQDSPTKLVFNYFCCFCYVGVLF